MRNIQHMFIDYNRAASFLRFFVAKWKRERIARIRDTVRTRSRSLLLETFIWMKSHFLLQCTRVSEYLSFEDRQRSTTTKETEVRCNDRSSSRSVVGARNRRNDFEKLSFYFYMGALSRSLTPRQRHLPYILHPRVSHMYVPHYRPLVFITLRHLLKVIRKR